MSFDNNGYEQLPESADGDEGNRRLARLALLIDQPDEPASGRTPNLEELWDWMHGEVDEARSAQIRSHLARDPDLYQQWFEMRLAENEFGVVQDLSTATGTTGRDLGAEASPNHKAGGMTGQHLLREDALSESKSPSTETRTATVAGQSSTWQVWLTQVTSFLKPSPYGGLVVAAILGAVVTVNLTRTQPVDIWADWQSPKSFDSSEPPADISELTAVLAGIASELKELSIPVLAPNGEKLPHSIPECSATADDTGCATRRSVLYELGQLSIRARVVCLTSYDMPAAIVAEISAINAKLGQADAVSRFSNPVAQWAESSERRIQCASVNQIIAQALKGLAS